jgi:hypothetical protein
VVLSISFTIDNEAVSCLYYFVPTKKLALADPGLKADVFERDGNFMVRISSEYLAKNIFLSSEIPGHFNRNFFDLEGGKTIEVIFQPDERIKTIPVIKMKSMADYQ